MKTRKARRSATATLAVILCAVVSPKLPGAELRRPYDGLTAGEEAHQRHQARRRAEIAMQIATIQQMAWYSGLPPAGWMQYPRGYPPSLDYIYAFGTDNGLFGQPPRAGGGLADVFEPWPYVPGDIWGYPWYWPVPQPIGRIEIQTGPNRWESHPVYAPPPPKLQTAPKPKADAPSTPSSAPPGPREF